MKKIKKSLTTLEKLKPGTTQGAQEEASLVEASLNGLNVDTEEWHKLLKLIDKEQQRRHSKLTGADILHICTEDGLFAAALDYPGHARLIALGKILSSRVGVTIKGLKLMSSGHKSKYSVERA